MSARSRALDAMADHFELLRDGGPTLPRPPKDGPTLYNSWDCWDRAAEMARATAREERWRERIPRLIWKIALRMK